jgi:hypothetical protein
MITYKYRLYPNKFQQELLWKHANALNFLYNVYIEQKITLYKQYKNYIFIPVKPIRKFNLTKAIEQIREHISVDVTINDYEQGLNRAYRNVISIINQNIKTEE